MTRSQIRKKKDKQILLVFAWIILSLVYAMYFYFYRVPLIAVVIVAIGYVIFSFYMLTSGRNRKENKTMAVLLTCILLIVSIISFYNVIYWEKQDESTQEYHEYLKTKPENILLQKHVVGTP